jgi:hypothetical protein
VECLVLRVMGVLRSTSRIRHISLSLLIDIVPDSRHVRKKYTPCTCHQNIDRLRLLGVQEAEEVVALKEGPAVGSVLK